MEHNAELKEFLRTRRARLNVDDMQIAERAGYAGCQGCVARKSPSSPGGDVGYTLPQRLEPGRELVTVTSPVRKSVFDRNNHHRVGPSILKCQEARIRTNTGFATQGRWTQSATSEGQRTDATMAVPE